LFCHLAEGPNTEALLAKKRKSMEEATRAKDTCPNYFEENLIVASQLQSSRDEVSSLSAQLLKEKDESARLLREILVLDRMKAHFEKERSTVFRDACNLYKRGIIELQLSVFMNEHDNEYNSFTCDGVVHQKTFSEAMHHWCECRHHTVEILKSHKEDKINL